MQTRWTERYALRTQSMKSSVIRELLKLTADPQTLKPGNNMPLVPLSPEELRDHSITFMFAGHETTSNSLQFDLGTARLASSRPRQVVRAAL